MTSPRIPHQRQPLPCDGQHWMADIETPHGPRTNTYDQHIHPDIARAAAICATCPIRTRRACLTYALTHDIAGYVAGTLPHQREQLRARRTA